MAIPNRLRALPLLLALPAGLVMCGSQPSKGGASTAEDGGSSGSGSGGNGSSGVTTTSSGNASSGVASGSTSSGTSSGASTSTSSGAGTDSGSTGSSGVAIPSDAGLPADCPASDVGNTALPPGMDTPDPTGVAVNAISYTNVGETGSYDQVVSGPIPSACGDACTKATLAQSGPLAPFTEEMTLVFSGPLSIYQVAVYNPAGGGSYERAAYWDRCTTEGLAWVGNKQWYTCNGYVQSYVTDDGTASSPTPVQFAGDLAAGVGVNIMSDVLCTGTTAGSDCGFSMGLALHGFAGDSAGNKIFVAKFRMPIGDVTPAYWLLPAQVVRTGQYGCNCRGEGGQGGCGEIDVAEVLGGATATPAHPEQATTTIYSFQGVTNGGNSYFQRPVYVTATFVVIFDAATSTIAERRLGATDFNFDGTIPAATVQGWLANMGTVSKMPN
jgi:hypothetical protein